MDAWRQDSEARQAAKDADTERRRVAEWLGRDAVRVQRQLDDKIKAAITEAIETAIAAEREFTTQVLIELTAHVNDEIRKLRDEVRQLQEPTELPVAATKVIDLPALPLRRIS
jgi:hypothetical protein